MSFSLSGSLITQTGTDNGLSGLSAVAGVTTSTQGKQTVYDIGSLRLEVSGTWTFAATTTYERLQFAGSATNDSADITVLSGGVLTIGTYAALIGDYSLHYGNPVVAETIDSTNDSSGNAYGQPSLSPSMHVASGGTLNIYGRNVCLTGAIRALSGSTLSIDGSDIACNNIYPYGTYSITRSTIRCWPSTTARGVFLVASGSISEVSVYSSAYLSLSLTTPAKTYTVFDVPALATGQYLINYGASAAGVVIDAVNVQSGTNNTFYYENGTRYFTCNIKRRVLFDCATPAGVDVDGAMCWVKGGASSTAVTGTTASGQAQIDVLLGAAVMAGATYTWTRYSVTGDSTDDFTYRVRSFGHLFVDGSFVLKGTGSLLTTVTMVADSRVTAASKAAAQAVSGIAWDAVALSITADVSTAEMWDWVKAWLCDNPAEDEADYIGAVALDFADLDINVAAGVTITGTLTTGGTVTLGSGASISGVYVDAAGTHVTISAASLVSGSRVQLYNVTDSTEIYNGVLASTGLTYATTWTSDKTIRLRADHPDYLPLEATGILTASGLTFLSEQAEDTIYVGNGIDGSTVTEFTADGLAIHVDVSDPDGYTLVQRLYAWLQHYQTTSAGIASAFFGAMAASDSANYVIDQDKADIHLNNVAASPLMIVGGYLTRKDGSTVIAATSGSIQMDPGRAYVAPGGAAITVPEGERVILLQASGTHIARG